MNDSKQSIDSPTLAAALALAARGFRVLPTCPAQTGCNSPGCKKGKHPLLKKWQIEASSDPAQIRKWFAKHPNNGVGIATGPDSGIFVIDTDGEEGQQSLNKLMEEHGPLPFTLTAITSRGRHRYFKYSTTGVKVISRTDVAPKLDVRGAGGFVVCPPSQHVSGVPYQWIGGADTPIEEAPDWLIKLVSKPKPKTLAVVPSPDKNADDLIIAEGDRHKKLVSIGRGLRASGMDQAEILEHLLAVNRDACQPPLSDAEVSKIAASASKYEAGRSRSNFASRRATREKVLPYLPLYVNDWLSDRDILCMDTEQRGLYWMLILESWRSCGVLEDDDNLWRLARADSREVFESKKDGVLCKFDSDVDEQGKPILIHRTIVDIWKRQYKTWKERVVAGKASAEKKRLADKKTGKPIEAVA